MCVCVGGGGSRSVVEAAGACVLAYAMLAATCGVRAHASSAALAC